MTLSLLNISTSTMYAIESGRQENVFSLPWAAELVGQILNVQTACVKGRFGCLPCLSRSGQDLAPKWRVPLMGRRILCNQLQPRSHFLVRAYDPRR